jgi:hypothetical protein
MNASIPLVVLAAVGLGATPIDCQPDPGSACTPFPPPSTTGAACSPLPPRTLLRDLGDLKPGGGHSSTALTVDDTAIYFTAIATPAPIRFGEDDGAPSLYRMPKLGGSLQVLDDNAEAPIVVDGATLVYTRDAANYPYPGVATLSDQCGLKALPTVGGVDPFSFGPVVDAAGGVSWLAGWQGPGPPTAVLHWNPTTQATVQIGALAAEPTGFVGDSDRLYWSMVARIPGSTRRRS